MSSPVSSVGNTVERGSQQADIEPTLTGREDLPEQSLQSILNLNSVLQPTAPSPALHPTAPVDEIPNELYDEDEAANHEESDSLALDALKKLSLKSSQKGNNIDNHKSATSNAVDQDNIDLSTFASLTRQPRIGTSAESGSVLNNLVSVASEAPAVDSAGSSDGLALRPMRRGERGSRGSNNPMNQFERRRPVSPSPLLKGDFLDLPVKSSEEQQQQRPRQKEDTPVTTRIDHVRSDPNLLAHGQHDTSMNRYMTETSTFSSPAKQSGTIISHPMSETSSEINSYRATAQTAPQQPPLNVHSYSAQPVIQNADFSKDPQSINKLKRPLYVPAVLRPTLATNYGERGSSSALSLNSDGGGNTQEYSRDLLKYKEYNDLAFGTNGRKSPIGSAAMSPSISQHSSLSSTSAAVQTGGAIGPAKLTKIFDKIMSSRTNSSSSVMQQPNHLKQQQSQQSQITSGQQSQTQSPTVASFQQIHLQKRAPSSDASSIMSNSSSTTLESGPTREHWKSDTVALRCFNCNKIFTNFGKIRRKHHCRSCGNVFCTNCINHFIYLDKDAKFVLIDAYPERPATLGCAQAPAPQLQQKEEKFLSKVCYQCFENYENLLRQKNPAIFHLQRNFGQYQDQGMYDDMRGNDLYNEKYRSGQYNNSSNQDRNQTEHDDDNNNDDDNDDDDDDDDGISKGDDSQNTADRSGSVSLPADWNWSSF